MDGWNTGFLLGWPIFRGELLVSGSLPSLKLTARAPENGWLEYWFPFGMAYFQGRTVSFRESTLLKTNSKST